MTGRRNANRIRGPQSALTDFLAANNISAAQIRDDYERRRREADQQDATVGASDEAQDQPSLDDAVIAAAIQAEDAAQAERESKSKKRKRSAKDAAEKVKKAKALKKHKKRSSYNSDHSEEDHDVARDMYKKVRPLPGQFAHCESCSKRFTVTPYNKEGPDGGLLCTPCGKLLAKDAKAEKKAASKPAGRKRRKLESDRLDGMAIGGARSLQQLCISKVARLHADIEELGEMPQQLLEKLSAIFSKQRVMKPRTLPLFLRPDLDAVVVHDAADLEVENYRQIFATVSNMERLVLGNTCQMKDEGIEYMLERCKKLKHLQLYAANLVSNTMWHRLFREIGKQLEVVKLKWLDAAFEDTAVQDMVEYLPNLKRVKLKLCRRIGEDAVKAISKITKLEHLSLMLNKEVSKQTLVELVRERGSLLQTLSLENFVDADDEVLASVHNSCQRLSKLRFCDNDTATDAGFESLFTDWNNPPLTFIDVHSNRDIDNNNPNGPEESIGVASAAFRAMMLHSGPAIKHLDIASCRHIRLSAFMDVFNGAMTYPALEYINISFCNAVDTSVVVGIFKSCPALKQLIAFGCFNVHDVIVPRAIAMIGVPTAQDAIEQFGVGIGVDEAIGRMVEVGA